jgi:hypothetical protein
VPTFTAKEERKMSGDASPKRRRQAKRKHPQEWVRVQVRLKPEDEAALRQIAASEARSPSNLLRLLALRHIEQRTAQQTAA